MLDTDDRKFQELVLYLASRSETDPRFGATKLNKLLYHCDFKAYELLGSPMTGQAYQKLQFGPAPRRLKPVVAQMCGRGDCFEWEREHFGRVQKRLLPKRDADLSVFTPQEVDLINQVIEELWQDTASGVSERSHDAIGWRAAQMGEDIPYSTVFVGDPLPLTLEEEEYARGVIEEYLAVNPECRPGGEV
jgi:Protein of unknown function (DUF4065)